MFESYRGPWTVEVSDFHMEYGDDVLSHVGLDPDDYEFGLFGRRLDRPIKEVSMAGPQCIICDSPTDEPPYCEACWYGMEEEEREEEEEEE